MTENEVTQLLYTLAAAWPGIDVGEHTIRLWVRECSDIPVDQARQAARRLVRSDKRFPSIARFIEEATATTKRDEDSTWEASPTCPLCRGTGLVTDAKGRDWLCRCATYERRRKPHNTVTAPPEELLEAARQALKEAP